MMPYVRHQGQWPCDLDFDLEAKNSFSDFVAAGGILQCFTNTPWFLARRDECPESYCRTPGVGVGVGVGVRVYKNFNLAYNSWTTIGRVFIFHMCIPCDKTFPWVPKFLT